MAIQNTVANVEHFVFDLEEQLQMQIGAQPLPFPGMDKSCAAVCQFFKYTSCTHGAMCPYRHVRGEKTVVCKHWLRGLCKKGDECEFLHQYDMTKMPECFFFTKFGMCSNKECPFLHVDPMSKVKDCPWYDRGFCKHGPLCKNRHVRRVMCQNYLTGLCLDGAACKFQHPKWDLPLIDMKENIKKITCHNCHQTGHKSFNCPNEPTSNHSANTQQSPTDANSTYTGYTGTRRVFTCHNCQQPGHKAYECPNKKVDGAPQQGIITCHNCQQPGHKSYECPNKKEPPQQVQVLGSRDTNVKTSYNSEVHNKPFQRRPVDTVTCFKCGEKGHYANVCPQKDSQS